MVPQLQYTQFLMVLFACVLTSHAFAEDWGVHALIPVSVPVPLAGLALFVHDDTGK